MRIRSAVAVTVLGIALAAAGTTSAFADEGPRHHAAGHHYGIDNPVFSFSSKYFGGIDTSSSDIVWGAETTASRG